MKMRRETVVNICGSIVLLCLASMFCIFGTVENGGSLWLMLWCIPVLAVMACAGVAMDYRPKIRIKVKGRMMHGFRANSNR